MTNINILYLSESGYPGHPSGSQKSKVKSQKSKVRIFLSESGYPGFEDLWLTPRFVIRMLLDDFLLGSWDFSGCF
ncbi:hypothetical protein H5968_14575 [Sphaerospermopsis sp. LEGE 00249]|nr:hypothetical protein [Sphaerospermopsis sp. LEGE 00249]